MPQLNLADIHKPDQVTTALGYAVIFRMNGVSILHTDLAQQLSLRGFGSYLPDVPTPYVALRRALLSWTRAEWPQPLRVATISKQPPLFALVEEETNLMALHLDYQLHLRVFYDEATANLVCTRTVSGPIQASLCDQVLTDSLRPIFNHARVSLISEDLSRVVRAIIHELDAVRLQRGIYFVPVQHKQRLYALDELVAQLPGSGVSTLVTLERLDDLKTRQHLQRAIHSDFLQALSEQQASISTLLALPQPPLKALTAQIQSFRALHAKAKVYADLLAERYSDITKQIDHLQGLAHNLVLFGAETFSD